MNKNMNIWLIADTHFNHKKMVEYCGRPSNFTDMTVKSLFNTVNNEEDVLIHLGDVTLGDNEKDHLAYIVPLKCKKWLVRGSHDNQLNGWYLKHGWDFVADWIMMEHYGKKILFSHEPIQYNPFVEINIHGHLHNNLENCLKDEGYKKFYKKNKFHRLVSLEELDYKPVSLPNFLGV